MHNKIRRFLALICVSLIVLFLIAPIYAETISSKATLDRQVIREKLEGFDTQSAYDLLQEFVENYSFNSAPVYYLESLSELMLLEKRYRFVDKMVLHAIDLYKLSGDDERYRKFKIIALEGLANYDYYNYENTKMGIKLNQMLQTYIEMTGDSQSSVYLEGLALLAIDQREYAKARTHLLEALQSLPANSAYDASRLNLRAYYKFSIAETYIAEDDYKTAVTEISSAIVLLHPGDVDALTAYNTSLAKYALKANQLDVATNALKRANNAYAKTGNYFKQAFLQTEIEMVEGELAFLKGDYQLAAEKYRKLFSVKGDPDSVTQAIAAQEAFSNFELEDVQEQLSLLEQLKDSQSKQLKLQANILNTAYVAIVLMFLLVIGIMMSLRWRIKQHGILYQVSITDQLTQIFNRGKIMSSYENFTPGEKCVAMLDIDRFKAVNDTYGHLVGDEVLRRVAKTIKATIREKDEIGRYGGEEFLLILDTPSLAEANAIVERVRLGVEALVWDHPGLKTTISIGLVYSQTHHGDLLLTEADSMLYLAKEEGRNRIKSIEV